MDLIQEARAFAVWAHESIDQRRRYTNDPYIIHPEEVARLVEAVPHTKEMIAAAYLHDTAEDVPWVTLDMIKERFGELVFVHVSDLTDVSKKEDGNRAVRKAIDLAHTAKALPGSKTIKLADSALNIPSIVLHDPKFALTYLPEKLALLDVLKEGDPVLFKMVQDVLEQGFKDLNEFKNHEKRKIRP